MDSSIQDLTFEIRIRDESGIWDKKEMESDI